MSQVRAHPNRGGCRAYPSVRSPLRMGDFYILHVSETICGDKGSAGSTLAKTSLKGFPTMRKLFPTLLTVLLCGFCSASSLGQQAVHWPGVTAVGSAASQQMVTLTLPSGGVVDSIRVTTLGSTGFDFADAGSGTCVSGAVLNAGQSCTVSVNFHPASPGERRGAVVLLDRAGSPLTSKLISASAVGPIGTFVPGTISTIAGDQAWIYAGDNELANNTAIFLPFGFAINAAGDLFVADAGNNRIRKVDAVSNRVSTIAGNGIIGGTGDGGPATLATLNNPTSIALDALGDIYFSDSGNNVVRRIDVFTGAITTAVGTMGQHGYSGDSGAASNATLNSPNGLAFDSAGNLYIADTGNHSIRLVNGATQAISTIVGRGFAAFGGDEGPATAALLNGPWSVTLSPAGELYIADQNNMRIRKVDATGIIHTVIGTGIGGFSGDGKLAALAQLDVPASVAIDVAGNIYVADSGNNRVRKVNAKTGLIDTVAGNFSESISGDDGPADQAGLYGPYTLALNGQDDLYIADVFHNRIRKISSSAATLEYVPMRAGRVSAPLVQVFENDGNAPLVVAGVSPVSQAQLDVASTVCAPGVSLAPLDTCQVGADFAPTTTGDRVKGSVKIDSNATNGPNFIALAGHVLDVDPTSLSLASSINPTITGVPVTFSVLATSAGTVPTGNVTFLDGTTPLGTVPLQTGGIASFTTSTLSGGQRSITVAYDGDTSNSAAVSSPFIETIKDLRTATTATLGVNFNPIDAGASLTLNVSVNVKALGSGTAPVAGIVTFLDGSKLIGTASISAATATIDKGSATLTLATLPVGTHSITASYAGNTVDGPSVSAPIAEVVHIATTQITLTSTANPSTAGTPLSLTASISSTGGIPTGSITFLDSTGLAPLGTATLNSQGVATLLTPGSVWAPGLHILTATYNGDQADAPGISQALPLLINIASTSVTLSTSLNPAGLGAAISLIATVSGNGGPTTGTVNFFDAGGKVLGSGSVSAASTTTLQLSSLAVGSHPITAVYSGDVLDAPSTSTPLLQVIQTATIGITLTSSKNPALYNDALSFIATVSGSGSKPIGVITFTDGANTVLAATMDPSGQAVFTTSALSIGAHTLLATYSGDTNHTAVTSAPLIENVLQTTSTSLAVSSAHTLGGVPVTFTANVVGSNGKSVSGLVNFTDITAASAPVTIASVMPNSAGVAVYTGTLPVGIHIVSASYEGDASNASSSSASVSLQVEIATTSTALTASPNPVNAGSALTLSSAVTSNGGTPGGSVTFHDGASILSTVPLNSSGIATLTLTTLPPGTHLLSASYSGDPNDKPSLSPTVSQQITLQTSVLLRTDANPALLTDNLTLTVTVGNGGASSLLTGSVTFNLNGAMLATVPVDRSGRASYVLPSPALGQHTLLATYSGDDQNAPGASRPLLEIVTLRPTGTTLNTSSPNISAGKQIILVAVVQPTQSVIATVPTGKVIFRSGTTILGTEPITSTGVATLTLTPVQGNYNITTEYSGDPLYSPSTSSAVSLIVGPTVEFTVLAAPPTLSMQTGKHQQLQLTLTSAPSFADTLAFGCAGLPSYATCTFSANQIAVAGGVSKTFTVNVDTGTPLGAGPSAHLTNPGGGGSDKTALLACMLPAGAFLAFFLGRGRRSVRPFKMLAVLLTLAGVSSALTGCASSFTQSATPVGSYTFQVVGTGNVTGASQITIIQLTVTQ